MSDQLEAILRMRERLNKVSPSFCLAKWVQVTLHLQNGLTHSCHHPNTHKIPLDELTTDPSALHNTEFKKLQRKSMLNGERPKECAYCWTVEDTAGDNISDRYIKSEDHWAKPHFEKIASSYWKENINPSYLEVSFSNTCNLKCAYCAPHISSKWMEEIREFGPYKDVNNYNDISELISAGKMPILESEPNPFVEAFWKWWPDLVKELSVFRITGGEPLLTKNTFKILDYLDAHPQPHLELCINSNLSVPFSLLEKLAKSTNALVQKKSVKSITIYTSVDTHGKQAEYIRYGLDYSVYFKNIEFLLREIPSMQIVIMCTFNALSISSFQALLDDVIRIKREFGRLDRSVSPIVLDVSFLRHPGFLNVKTLTGDFVQRMEAIYWRMIELKETPGQPGFSNYEIAKFERIIEMMKSPDDSKQNAHLQASFYNFVTEYDRRRKTDFLKTFPDMEDFFNLCKQESYARKILKRAVPPSSG